MRAYLLSRIVQSLFVVFVVTSIMFVMFRIMPSDPTAMLVDRGMPEEARLALLEKWGLTGSLWDQYLRYFGNLAVGDFGDSFFYRQPVWDVLWPLIINSLILAIPGLLLGALIGAGLGMVVGWSKRGGRIENIGIFVATVARGTPSFIVGIALLAFFSSWLGWFPAFGMGDPGDEHSVKFEHECYDVGHLYNLKFCMDQGLFEAPIFLQFVLGILGGIGPDLDNLLFMKRTADRLFGDSYHWSVLGAGNAQMKLAPVAAQLGGNVRVGLEDSLFLDRGKLADSNADQVRKVRRLLEDQGYEIATSEDARTMLELKGGDRVSF